MCLVAQTKPRFLLFSFCFVCPDDDSADFSAELFRENFFGEFFLADKFSAENFCHGIFWRTAGRAIGVTDEGMDGCVEGQAEK